MLEINLLPIREERRKEDLRQQGMVLVLALLLAAAAIGFVHSHISEQIEIAQGRVHQMQRDIDQFKPQLEQVAAFRNQKAQLEKKIDVIEELDRQRSGPVRILSELASRVPERVWLTDVRTEGSTITMQGESLDNELVAHFLRALGDSPYFGNVDLDRTELGQDKGGLKVVQFDIRGVVVNPKAEKADGA